MSGLCVQKAFTWMASEQDLLTTCNHFWTTSKRQDVAIQRIIPAVMKTVTMKMLLFHSTPKVGVNARRMVITWPVSTKVTAMNLTVLTSSNAVNISWELQMLKTVIILFPSISLYKKRPKKDFLGESLISKVAMLQRLDSTDFRWPVPLLFQFLGVFFPPKYFERKF